MEDDVPVSAAGAVTSAPTSPPPATPSAPRRSGGSGRKSASGGASRLRKSCDPCSLAKRKCDGKPECSLCVKKGLRCIYGERQKSGPKGRKGSAPTAGSTTPRRRAPFVPARESRSLGPDDGTASPARKRTRPATAGHYNGVERENPPVSYEETEHGSAGRGGGLTHACGAGPGSGGDARGGGHGHEPAVAGHGRSPVAAAARMGHLKRRVGAGTLVGHQEPAEDHPMRDDEMHERAMGVSDGYSSYPPNKFRRTPAGAWGGRARQEEAERTLVQQQQHARRNALPGGIIHHDSHEDGGPGTAGTGGHPSNPEMTRSPDANGSSHHVDSSSPHRQQSWGPGQQRRPVSPSHVSRADLGTPGSGTAASAPGTYHLGHEATSNATSSSWRASSGGGSDSGAGWQPRRQEDAGGGRGGAGSAVGISRPFSEQGVDDSGEISETSDRRGGGGSGRGGEYHRGTTGGRGSGSGSVASGEADIKYERYCQGGRRAFGGGGPAPPAVMRDGEGGYWEYPLGSSGGQGRVANREYWTHGAPSGTYARWDSRGVDPDRREDLRAWGGMHRPGAMDDHGDPEEYNERRHLLPWSIEKIETMQAMGAGRAGQDKTIWDRIAAAMMSSAAEAKEQWAMYCDTMRREAWAVRSRATALAASITERSPGIWPVPPSAAVAAGGPPPTWSGTNPHGGWRLRPDGAAGGYVGSAEGTRPVRAAPDVDVYRDAAAYGPGRPPAVVGQCAYCREYWQTNSPPAAAALEAGRWCCPPCESGRRPGPHPRHWEDDEGHIAMATSDIPHLPYYDGDGYPPPAHSRRQGWTARRAPPPRGGGPPGTGDWDEDASRGPIAAEASPSSRAGAAGRGTHSAAGEPARRISPGADRPSSAPAPTGGGDGGFVRSGSERRATPTLDSAAVRTDGSSGRRPSPGAAAYAEEGKDYESKVRKRESGKDGVQNEAAAGGGGDGGRDDNNDVAGATFVGRTKDRAGMDVDEDHDVIQNGGGEYQNRAGAGASTSPVRPSGTDEIDVTEADAIALASMRNSGGSRGAGDKTAAAAVKSRSASRSPAPAVSGDRGYEKDVSQRHESVGGSRRPSPPPPIKAEGDCGRDDDIAAPSKMTHAAVTKAATEETDSDTEDEVRGADKITSKKQAAMKLQRVDAEQSKVLVDVGGSDTRDDAEEENHTNGTNGAADAAEATAGGTDTEQEHTAVQGAGDASVSAHQSEDKVGPRDVKSSPEVVEAIVKKLLSERSDAEPKVAKYMHQNGEESDANVCMESHNKTRKAWTEEEDRKLEKAVEANNGLENDPKNGSEADWAAVARKLSTDRTAGECRSRWLARSEASPTPQEMPRWSKAEEEVLFMKHKFIGPQWAEIAKLLPGRTATEVKKYFHVHVQRVEHVNATREGDDDSAPSLGEPKNTSAALDSRAVSESPSGRTSGSNGEQKETAQALPSPGGDGFEARVQHMQAQQHPFPSPPLASRRPHDRLPPASTEAALSVGHSPPRQHFNRHAPAMNSGPPPGSRGVVVGSSNSRTASSLSDMIASRPPSRSPPPPQSHRSTIDHLDPAPQNPLPASGRQHYPSHRGMRTTLSNAAAAQVGPYPALPPRDEPSVNMPAPRTLQGGGEEGRKQGQHSMPPPPPPLPQEQRQMLPNPPSGSRGWGAGAPRAVVARGGGAGSYVWSCSVDAMPRLAGFARKSAPGDWAVAREQQQEQSQHRQESAGGSLQAGRPVMGADRDNGGRVEHYWWYGGRSSEVKPGNGGGDGSGRDPAGRPHFMLPGAERSMAGGGVGAYDDKNGIRKHGGEVRDTSPTRGANVAASAAGRNGTPSSSLRGEGDVRDYSSRGVVSSSAGAGGKDMEVEPPASPFGGGSYFSRDKRVTAPPDVLGTHKKIVTPFRVGGGVGDFRGAGQMGPQAHHQRPPSRADEHGRSSTGPSLGAGTGRQAHESTPTIDGNGNSHMSETWATKAKTSTANREASSSPSASPPPPPAGQSWTISTADRGGGGSTATGGTDPLPVRKRPSPPNSGSASPTFGGVTGRSSSSSPSPSSINVGGGSGVVGDSRGNGIAGDSVEKPPAGTSSGGGGGGIVAPPRGSHPAAAASNGKQTAVNDRRGEGGGRGIDCGEHTSSSPSFAPSGHGQNVGEKGGASATGDGAGAVAASAAAAAAVADESAADVSDGPRRGRGFGGM